MNKRNKKIPEKFQFDSDFQEHILQFTVTDRKNGFKALQLYNPSYFSLLEHAIIAEALKNFYKKKKRVPGKIATRELLRETFLKKDYINTLTDDDKNRIYKIINKIYYKPAEDPDDIMEKIKMFARYISVKSDIENFDITDISEYNKFANKLQKSMGLGTEDDKDMGAFLVRSVKMRQIKRKRHESAEPTPYWQFNHFFNSGGPNIGSVLVFVGAAKRFKTGVLINMSRGYLKLRKKVLYIDLENGEEAIITGLEQSIIDKTKKEILSGEYNDKIKKIFRKLDRMGSEIVVKRFPAYSTTANHIESYIDEIYRETGIEFDIMIIDFLDLLGSLSAKKEEKDRISDAYVDIKNLTDKKKLITYTVSHISREGVKRESSKFTPNDLAKCIDKIRHADGIYGLNQNEDEKEDNIMRWEIIDQRDGKPDGNAYFKINMANRRLNEFTKKELESHLADRIKEDVQ